jgi:hypothetical protein
LSSSAAKALLTSRATASVEPNASVRCMGYNLRG